MQNRQNYIKRTYLKLLVGVIILFLGATFFNACSDKKIAKDIIYSSDFHTSLPEGRWAYTTKKYENFLKKLNLKDEIFFVNGDYIDNAYVAPNGRLRAGDAKYQEKETKMFLELTEKYINNSKMLLNFGAGHDFGNLELAEKLTNTPRIGKYKWGNIDLIWFTVTQAAFENDGRGIDVLKDDYAKLEKILNESDNAILFSHIPLRGETSFELGKWSSNRNLTIPTNDRLYGLIDKNEKKIVAIFMGHIHRTYKDYYKSIPMYSFPLLSIDGKKYSRISQYNKYISILPENKEESEEKIFY